MITTEDKELCSYAISRALEEGASKARVTITRSTEDLVSTLDREIDKITHCCDSSLTIAIFSNKRFGSFSTNKLDSDSLKAFIHRAVGIVNSLAEDSLRDLPSPERCCKTARDGNELDLLDPEYAKICVEDRIKKAMEAFIDDPGIISAEGEYSDSLYETLVMDSQGVCCIHRENSFDYGIEITIEHRKKKYSAYSWDSASRLSGLDVKACSRDALDKASAQIGSKAVPGRKCNMVVDRDVASKMVSPILRALGGYSLQQNDSFLQESLGKKIFPEGMTLIDDPHISGQNCSKLFDTEGVATKVMPIVEKGVVKNYFLNTYMAAKMNLPATVEDAVRPHLMGWPREGLDREDLLKMCGDGILVTEFNGGNCNTTTGDFSYGIEGFEFKDGIVGKPISGMLVTGNYLSLWSNLIAAASDQRPRMSKLIPTLAFSNVDFNGQ